MPIEHVTDAVPTWIERQKIVAPFHDYYRGRQPLRFATADFRRKYGQVVAGVRENVCVAAVTGFVDEIEIESWDGPALDEALLADLERLAVLVFVELLRAGDAYVIVAERSDGTHLPIYQPADSVVPVVDDEDPTVLARAVKLWVSDDRYCYATVYYEDRLERYRTRATVKDDKRSRPNIPTDPRHWAEHDPDGDDSWYQPHEFNAVPVVWFKHDPDDHWGHGHSILGDVLPIQDLLNKSTADMAVVAEAYSRPLYWILKMKPSDLTAGPGTAPHPLAGAQTNGPTASGGRRPFDATRQQVMAIDGEGPVGQFTPGDLSKLIGMRADLRQAVSTVTGLPQFHFTPTSGDVPSGESLRVVSRRQAAVIKRATRPTIPLWRGLLELLGHEGVTPVFRQVNATETEDEAEDAPTTSAPA